MTARSGRVLAVAALSASLLGGCVPMQTQARATQTGSSASVAPGPPTPTPHTDATAVPLAPAGRAIEGARISVPRLGIDLPLAWGDIGRDMPRSGFEGATPERIAFVFPGSALPGAAGNTFIYAHARAGMFINLWSALPGDLVLLSWPDASLRYAISEVHPRVDASDASWLDPRGSERLTLQTSTGPRASDPRFIAIAIPLAAN